MIEWHEFSEKMPEKNEVIVIELEGSKICRFMKGTLRYGEGLGSYKRWCNAKQFDEYHQKLKESL